MVLAGVAPKKRERRLIVSPAAGGPSLNDLSELIETGRAAMADSDYQGAVQAWRRARVLLAARDERDPRLDAALAEAHFRCGILARPANLDDLSEAIRLNPDEPRYHYHWALARQRRGAVEMAIPVYRALLERKPPYTRAAYPLAVALLTARKQPNKDRVWEFLSDEERARIASAYALLRRPPRTSSPTPPRRTTHALWAGLAAFRTGDRSAAASLQAALDDPTLPPVAAAVARHYLGVLAWRQRQRPVALEHWQAAYSAGLRTEWLAQNLASGYKDAALALLETSLSNQSQHPDSPASDGAAAEPAAGAEADLAAFREVLRLAESGLAHLPDDPGLVRIANYARGQLGYYAARANDWSEAARYLWAAADAGDHGRATLTNAALTAEALNRFARAADLWQRVLRHRPRYTIRTHTLSQEQIAVLWQHVGDCFERTSDYDEAARAYRNVLRHQPDSVEARRRLAQVLVKAERHNAALPVINEILALRPDDVPTLILRAQVHEKANYLYGALQTWQQVLELDPEHPTVHQNLARLHCLEGDYHWERGDERRAAIAYREGLRHRPSDARLRASLALLTGQEGDKPGAVRELEALLREQPGDGETLYWVLDAYLNLGNWERAGALIQQLEHADALPSSDQLMRLAHLCYQSSRREWTTQLLELMERRCDDARTLLDVAYAYRDTGQDAKALRAFRRVIDLEPDNAEAHLELGMLLMRAGKDLASAQEHLQRAEQIALRASDATTMVRARLGKILVRSGAFDE